MSAPNQARNFIVTLLFAISGGPGILGVYLPAAIARWSIPPSPISLRVLAWLLIAMGLVPLAESIVRFMWCGTGDAGAVCAHRNAGDLRLLSLRAQSQCMSEYWPESGQMILFHSFALAAYAVLLTLGFHLFVTRYEEPTLRRKYGVHYDAFCPERAPLDSMLDAVAIRLAAVPSAPQG